MEISSAHINGENDAIPAHLQNGHYLLGLLCFKENGEGEKAETRRGSVKKRQVASLVDLRIIVISKRC